MVDCIPALRPQCLIYANKNESVFSDVTARRPDVFLSLGSLETLQKGSVEKERHDNILKHHLLIIAVTSFGFKCELLFDSLRNVCVYIYIYIYEP